MRIEKPNLSIVDGLKFKESPPQKKEMKKQPKSPSKTKSHNENQQGILSFLTSKRDIVRAPMKISYNLLECSPDICLNVVRGLVSPNSSKPAQTKSCFVYKIKLLWQVYDVQVTKCTKRNIITQQNLTTLHQKSQLARNHNLYEITTCTKSQLA